MLLIIRDTPSFPKGEIAIVMSSGRHVMEKHSCGDRNNDGDVVSSPAAYCSSAKSTIRLVGVQLNGGHIYWSLVFVCVLFNTDRLRHPAVIPYHLRMLMNVGRPLKMLLSWALLRSLTMSGVASSD